MAHSFSKFLVVLLIGTALPLVPATAIQDPKQRRCEATCRHKHPVRVSKPQVFWNCVCVCRGADHAVKGPHNRWLCQWK